MQRNYSRMMEKTNKKLLQQEATQGSGLFLYQNSSQVSSYILSKQVKIQNKMVKEIPPMGKFEGDSYYKQFVGKGLRLLQTIQPERSIMEESLILDQPDKFTSEGKTESVKVNPKKPLNEDVSKNPPVLINENPLNGVELI